VAAVTIASQTKLKKSFDGVWPESPSRHRISWLIFSSVPSGECKHTTLIWAFSFRESPVPFTLGSNHCARYIMSVTDEWNELKINEWMNE
jgi:hypothetical protein